MMYQLHSRSTHIQHSIAPKIQELPTLANKFHMPILLRPILYIFCFPFLSLPKTFTGTEVATSQHFATMTQMLDMTKKAPKVLNILAKSTSEHVSFFCAMYSSSPKEFKIKKNISIFLWVIIKYALLMRNLQKLMLQQITMLFGTLLNFPNFTT